MAGCGSRNDSQSKDEDGFEVRDQLELIADSGREDGAGADKPPPPKNNCEPDAPGSILALCADQGRKCVKTPDGAVCGECLKDYIKLEGSCHRPTCAAFVSGTITHVCRQQHRLCIEDSAAFPATCGECFAGYIDDAGGCRPVYDCNDLGCVSQFHRHCTPAAAHLDALCGGCLPGYQPVDPGELCSPLEQSNCQPGIAGSILLTCEEKHRGCVEQDSSAFCGPCNPAYFDIDGDGLCDEHTGCDSLQCDQAFMLCLPLPAPHCGPCLEGYAPSKETGNCTQLVTCEEMECDNRDKQCMPPSFSLGDDAYCYSPCPDKKVWHINSCVPCAEECLGPGQTGNLWPLAALDGECICETLDEYFVPVGGGGSAFPCDKDGDGWVRLTAMPAVEADDQAVSSNARCAVRRMNGVVLENEGGEKRTVSLAKLSPGLGSFVIALFEPDHLDDQTLPEFQNLPPYYPSLLSRGRVLLPPELNSLTKFCVAQGDFNGNGLLDVDEWHDPHATLADNPYLETFAAFSYFGELHRGWYEALSEDNPLVGRYVIREKSRLESADTGNHVPLQYDALFELDNGAEDPEKVDWLQQCIVWPNPAFAPGLANTVTMDFAPFGPEEPSLDFALLMPPHENQWDGMNHHSQYRCIRLGQPEVPFKEPHVVPIADLWDDAGLRLQLNRCTSPFGSDGEAQSSPPLGPSKNPSDPIIKCEPISEDQLLEGMVHFAAVRYRENTEYEGGCINQCWASKGRCGLCGGGVWLNQDDTICGAASWEAGYPGLPKECKDIGHPPDIPLESFVCDDCPWQQDCDDSSPCTIDLCHSDGECVSLGALDGGPCEEDGNDCTYDYCVNGHCLHEYVGDGVACTDDGNECTDDSCALVKGNTPVCVHDATVEGPEWPCTQGDSECMVYVCNGAGGCGIPVPGPLGEMPDGTEPVPCTNDGNVCIDYVCNGAGSCGVPKGIGSACQDDGNECTDDYCMVSDTNEWYCHHDTTVTWDCSAGLPKTCFTSKCADGICVANGDCSPGAVEVCGYCGTKSCDSNCHWTKCQVPPYLDDDYEPNDSAEAAFDLGEFIDSDNDTPMTVTGYVYPLEDADHYRLSILDQGDDGKPILTLIFEPPAIPPGEPETGIYGLCAAVWCGDKTEEEADAGEKHFVCMNSDDPLMVLLLEEYNCGAAPQDVNARFSVTLKEGAGSCEAYSVTFVVHEQGNPI